MSNELAIEVEGLSKRYTLRGPQQRYYTMRDAIMQAVRSPFRRVERTESSRSTSRGRTDFLALDNVSLTVHRGEAVGVMGHNGAGKSTLLKILSRITEPTKGSATLFGRVGSLLEVGTGFHLELSGRENIYLSGAILGMKSSEIREKFDEIVSFAEVEQFVDTPVKHYSSGMHLRLAFAVAAHLQPEILLIDEVLAVGDATFQKKCLGKMDDVAASGRTVLFVSHNLGAVKELCRTGIVLSHGRILTQGPVTDAISKYTESLQEENPMNSRCGWQRLEMNTPGGQADWIVQTRDAITYNSTLILPEEFVQGAVILLIHDSTGTLLVHQRIELDRKTMTRGNAQTLTVSAAMPPLWLAPSLYTVHLKFLGRTAENVDAKYVSERRILDVRGWSQDRANASLAPTCEWTMQTVGSRSEAVASW